MDYLFALTLVYRKLLIFCFLLVEMVHSEAADDGCGGC